MASEGREAPRVAIVCEWLTTYVVAEKVFKSINELFPDEPIFNSQ